MVLSIRLNAHTERYAMLFERWEKRALLHYAKLPVIFDKARGCVLLDVDGNDYIDATSGYSAVNLGHTHASIQNAVEGFMRIDENGWGQAKVVPNRAGTVALINYLERIASCFGYDRFIPMNSGAEAVETALKLALKWAYTKNGIRRDRGRVIVARGNFHGRTGRIVGLSHNEHYRKYFGPYGNIGIWVPFGDIDALRNVLVADAMMKSRRIVAFLVEPILGEGGIIVPSPGYLQSVRDLCREFDVLFIADEIQTGLGRSGFMLACDKEDVHPDMAILGKSLGGGLTVTSGVLLDDRLAVFVSGDHGSTFAGNPLAATIATVVINTLIDDKLCGRSLTVGAYLHNALTENLLHGVRASPHVSEIRGQGLMLGIGFKPGVDVDDMTLRILRGGVLAIGAHDAVRVCLPLVASHEICDEAVDRIAAALCT